MDTASIAVVAGFIVPFATDLLKRLVWVKSKIAKQLYLFVLCGVIATIALWLDDNLNSSEGWLTTLPIVYSTSQIVYNGFLKDTEIANAINGNINAL